MASQGSQNASNGRWIRREMAHWWPTWRYQSRGPNACQHPSCFSRQLAASTSTSPTAFNTPYSTPINIQYSHPLCPHRLPYLQQRSVFFLVLCHLLNIPSFKMGVMPFIYWFDPFVATSTQNINPRYPFWRLALYPVSRIKNKNVHY